MEMQRDYGIDFLKALGLFLIILAHTQIPEIVSQFRSFDVPLMVMISGILAQKTYKKGKIKEYWKKRYLRLIVPTHIFLIVFFGIMYLFARENLTFKLILNSFFLLHDSIGFVWIILVYFLCALLIPFIDRIDFNKVSTRVGMILLYLVYEILVYFKLGFSNNLFYSIFYFMIPYSIITVIGYNYDKLSKKDKLNIGIICLISNLVFMISNLIIQQKYVLYTQYKYPPTLYFLSYGILISIILIETIRKRKKSLNNKFISFVAQNSLWIYLIHILVLKVLENLLKDISWIIQYVLIITITLIIVYVKNYILNVIKEKTDINLKLLKG